MQSALSACEADDEVVVVDDGSVDHPRRIVPSDSRIVWLEQEPQGIVAALERGRSHCKGEFIARLDADDIALPGRIEAQCMMMESNPNIAVVGGHAEVFCDSGEVPLGMQHYVAWVNSLTNLHAQLLVESPLFHPATLLRASAIDAVGGYRNGDFPEDYDLWLRLEQAGFLLSAVNRFVVRIRDRSGRLTRSDTRYRMESFENLKLDWLRSGILHERRKVVVWGAGRTGKRWIRRILAGGHDVRAVIDIHCRTERQGIPVLAPERLSEIEFELLFVAVGARGAREKIRTAIGNICPDLVEGRDWWALA